MAKKTVKLEINCCNKCEHRKSERYHTSDSWDNIVMWNCTHPALSCKPNHHTDREPFRRPPGIGLIEWSDKDPPIPDWCPLAAEEKAEKKVMEEPVKFTDLIGKTVGFYGVDGNCFKLGSRIFQAIENESDGYRSYLESIEVKEKGNLVFSPMPLDYVLVEGAGSNPVPDNPFLHDFQGYQLRSHDNHVWLLIGTRNTDDYYPCFVFRYTPKY